MSGAAIMLLGFFGSLLLFFCFAFLVGNRPGAGSPAAPPDGAAERPARRRRFVKLAFWYSAGALAVHRGALAWLYSTMDFTDPNTQAGFGMSWWFLDPLAGFPIIFGTAPFARDIPTDKFMRFLYQPLSFLLYAGYIYGLWRLARHAFARPAAPAGRPAGAGN